VTTRRGQFKSAAVAGENSFLSCARYIERNPIEAGMVTEPWPYRWSSCPAYALVGEDRLIDYNVWYQGLGGDAPSRQQRWREFLLGDDPNEEVMRRHDWVEGGEDARRRLFRPQACTARRRGRPRKPPPGIRKAFFRNSMRRHNMRKLSCTSPSKPRCNYAGDRFTWAGSRPRLANPYRAGA
jgi:hypothetical protein